MMQQFLETAEPIFKSLNYDTDIMPGLAQNFVRDLWRVLNTVAEQGHFKTLPHENLYSVSVFFMRLARAMIQDPEIASCYIHFMVDSLSSELANHLFPSVPRETWASRSLMKMILQDCVLFEDYVRPRCSPYPVKAMVGHLERLYHV